MILRFLLPDQTADFWRRHPALLYGLSLLIGTFLALNWHWSSLLLAFAIYAPLCFHTPSCRRLLLALLLIPIAYTSVHLRHHRPALPESGIEGVAELDVSSVTPTVLFARPFWRYCGTIRTFQQKNGAASIGRNIPYVAYLPKNIQRPTADFSYRVRGTLFPGRGIQARFKPAKGRSWEPIGSRWNLAETRLTTKQAFASVIRQRIPDRTAASFLIGLSTGDFDDRLMLAEFGRFGLQHIMAISGFHFALIATMTATLLRFILPPRPVATILMALLSTYFLFIGCSPSILRAWVAIQIVLIGQLIGRTPVALNTLGLALCVVLVMDPLLSQHIGFQFSFLATAAILFFSEPLNQLLQRLLPSRRLSLMVEMNRKSQHAYILLSGARQALALLIAVHLVVLPLVLFLFHRFPVSSLLYNLFYPLLVSGSMFLLMIAFIADLAIPLVGTWIHQLNSAYTAFILGLVTEMPLNLDVMIRANWIPASSIVLYLAFLLKKGVSLNQKQA